MIFVTYMSMIISEMLGPWWLIKISHSGVFFSMVFYSASITLRAQNITKPDDKRMKKSKKWNEVFGYFLRRKIRCLSN